LLAAYAALVFAFIYLPIAVLIIYSFNRDGVGGFPPRHFTLGWYRQLVAAKFDGSKHRRSRSPMPRARRCAWATPSKPCCARS